jgi:predicted nucleic acid-binding protein
MVPRMARVGARRRLQLRLLLDRYPVFPYSKEVAEVFARIRAQRERVGRPMASADAWIAATAIHFDVPLTTHDGNFLDTPGLRVISANPKVCLMRDRVVETQRALDLNLRCGCGL